MGGDVRSPRRIHAHPERLLRGYPSVEGGFTNPSPVPIRLRECPSLPSCLSLPVAFLWRSWMRESCCSCHPCLCQPWRPLQLSVALLIPPDLRPPVRCLTSNRALPAEGLTGSAISAVQNSSQRQLSQTCVWDRYPSLGEWGEVRTPRCRYAQPCLGCTLERC